jgi:hypothetical protein
MIRLFYLDQNSISQPRLWVPEKWIFVNKHRKMTHIKANLILKQQKKLQDIQILFHLFII